MDVGTKKQYLGNLNLTSISNQAAFFTGMHSPRKIFFSLIALAIPGLVVVKVSCLNRMVFQVEIPISTTAPATNIEFWRTREFFLRHSYLFLEISSCQLT